VMRHLIVNEMNEYTCSTMTLRGVFSVRDCTFIRTSKLFVSTVIYLLLLLDIYIR